MNFLNLPAFNSRNIEYKKPFGAVAAGTKIQCRIRLPRTEAVSEAALMIEKDENEPESFPMVWESLDGSNDIYFCEYSVAASGLYFYWFEVMTVTGKKYICLDGCGEGTLSVQKGTPFQQTIFDASYKTPDWLKGGIMYQIFPDRFCREGEMPSKVPEGRILLYQWGKMPRQTEEGGYRSNDYFGGNLAGIISKLPYLKSIGVTAIYMNPIFEAHSYHRYNTADYTKIDPMLGTENDFKRLCAEAKKLGIRIILDGVFSHTGADSIYFNMNGRYSEQGAYQSQDSKYYNWYDFEMWPNKYRCWWGFKDLPEVNETAPDFLNFITADDGVARRWLKLGASGWRLDVADELPDKFLEKFRSCVKDENSENIILGEVWEDASNKISYGEHRHYLEGKQLDSVMNYPWRAAIINYIKTGEAEKLAESVMTLLENYPKQTIDVLMNLLGSHDTVRLITCFAGENSVGRSVEWKQDTHIPPDRREKGVSLVKLASSIQYFLPGVPCVYYGDEAGFEGYEDPFNRQCYIWGSEEKSLIDWYRQLSVIRKACPALKTGGYRQIAARDGLFAFERMDVDSSLMLAVNVNNYPVTLNAKGKLCLSLANAQLNESLLSLPAYSCAVVGNGSWIENINQ